MNPPDPDLDEILRALQERAKELECLYRIEELLKKTEAPLEEVFTEIVRAIPPGWQYPEACRACIYYEDRTYGDPPPAGHPWVQSAPIAVENQPMGKLCVYYMERTPQIDEGPFLKEERRLIEAIADRLAHFLAHQQLAQAIGLLKTRVREPAEAPVAAWRIIVDFVRSTDRDLYLRLGRKMLNHLRWSAIPEALALFQQPQTEGEALDDNRPRERRTLRDDLVARTFEITSAHLGDDEILSRVQRWIQEDNSRFIIQAVESFEASSEEVADAIRRYHHMGSAVVLNPAVEKGIRVALIARFLSDQPDYVSRAKRYLEVGDFHDLVEHTIFPSRSRGKLGGKSAGIFLAHRVLRGSPAYPSDLGEVKVPRSWYITSDGILDFITHNDLDEVHNQKYLDIEQVRQEYPHLVQAFKNCQVSPQIAQGLAVVLDELEGVPIIVRSSSLLEDRFGSAFAGKYKSLFLANQGSKPERMAELVDAIAEVYASTFGPDPIQYRAERDLIDAAEEMGILVQEVVGTRVGKYWLPAFSGVAFSRNEFRWSARIRRDDGLVRLVPGLGTRAVDRLKDDYPVLLAPGQPGLRVNVTSDEIARYSPKNADVVNLETGRFETVAIADLWKRHGSELPLASRIVSILDGDRLREPLPIDDLGGEQVVVTFEGLVQSTAFVRQIRSVLAVLETALGTPVDIEFASDGQDLYLLQCRPQSHLGDSAPVSIPRDIPAERTVFSANRFISNGRVENLTHVVYVDPERYNAMQDLTSMRSVGRAVGRLNGLLPKKQFVLMGPGRWGSRGDIKLGVDVSYADISNCAVLVEIARRKGNYVPDLSFGTHFFQDLVESAIRYLPLYPDDPGIVFDTVFLTRAPSVLPDLLPEFAQLADVVRVIDVPKATKGLVLQILMNAELDAAIGILVPPQFVAGGSADRPGLPEALPEQHWRWRQRFAEHIARELDPERFAVRGMWLIGSVKNATAGPASDIDLLVHFAGTHAQRRDLELWLEGWSLSLAEMNYLRTGYRTQGLLDVHVLTDDDFTQRSSYAVKVGAVTDPARPLPLGLGEAKP